MSASQVSCPRIVHTGMQSSQSIYETTLTQQHPIGEPGTLTGGRVFYYTRYSASVAVPVGKLCVAAVALATSEDLATATTAFAVGSTTATGITFGAATALANEFQYLQIIDGGGEGLCYRIKNHPAFTSGGVHSVELYDPIPVASDANTQVSFMKDLYADPVISVADQLDVPAGIPQVALPVTATAAAPVYAWLQTQGVGCAWVEGTPAEGVQLVADTTTVGNLFTRAASTYSDVAIQMSVGGTTKEVQSVYIQIRGV